VAGTHPQLLKIGDYYAYSKAYGTARGERFRRARSGAEETGGTSNTRAGRGLDPRVSTYELARENYETVNQASTTETLVNAAKRLVDEFARRNPGGSGDQALARFGECRRCQARRNLANDHPRADVGGRSCLAPSFPTCRVTGCHFALCYRARPTVMTRTSVCLNPMRSSAFRKAGAENRVGICGTDAEKWGPVLAQDFSNMSWFEGHEIARLSRAAAQPASGAQVTNFHRNLANYMGRGHATPAEELDAD